NMEGLVLDNRYYDVRYRMPHNLQQYTLQVRTRSNYIFESYSDYMDYTMKERMTQTIVSFGFAIPGIFEFGFNFNNAKFTRSVQKAPQGPGKVRFQRLAVYMLKSEGLMLHPEFLQRLRSLPQSYVYGEYRHIYRDFGTHFVTEAVLGGDYEHTIILDKEKLEKDYSLDDYKRCVQAGLKVGANIFGVYVTESRSAGSPSHPKLPTPQLMRLWGAGVTKFILRLSRQTRPLYELVTSRDFSYDAFLKRNLKRALSEYLAEASPCRCAPCLKNRTHIPVFVSCALIHPPPLTEIAIDGSWSCWGSWSSCSGNKRTRSRECNNPAPSSGGMSCRGLQQESAEC
uniref:Complement component 8, beta polypeptide n=1 Tax=Salarias fasciatus TaxID=181472 RepID=A0A672H8C6_SALFA